VPASPRKARCADTFLVQDLCGGGAGNLAADAAAGAGPPQARSTNMDATPDAPAMQRMTPPLDFPAASRRLIRKSFPWRPRYLGPTAFPIIVMASPHEDKNDRPQPR